MDYLVSVGGVQFPVPSEYSAKTIDIVDSGRNADGYIVSQIIRSNVASVEMVWRSLTVAQWSSVLSAFKNNFVNSVTFYDEAEGGYKTTQMYVGDRTAEMAQFENGVPVRWLNCKLSLIEV